MKVYYRTADGQRKVIMLGGLIGSGKEGDIYRVADDPSVCAKVYREPRPDARAHIEALLSLNSVEWYQRDEKHLEVAWPAEPFENADGTANGFFMQTIGSRYFPADDLFSVARRAADPSLNWGCHVAIAADLARVVMKLHAKDMLVGDLALANLSVSGIGRVVLLDSDSFVIRSGGATYGGGTWRPDNGAPEDGPGKHTRETDYFALAVVICILLLEEVHPFAGTDLTLDSEDERTPAASIARARSWLFHSDIRRPPGCPPPELIPGYLRDLAYAAFGKGVRVPSARPTAHDWYQALVRLGGSLKQCPRAPQHVFDGSGWDWCPWCERTHQQDGHDPFPATTSAPVSPPWLAAAHTASGQAGDAREAHSATVVKFLRGLRKGQLVSGRVTKVTKSGAFVNLGIATGLIRPADLSAGRDRHPRDILSPGQEVKVEVLAVDTERRHVSLSLRASGDGAWEWFTAAHQVGERVSGRVTRIVAFGAFVDLGGVSGLVHISELSDQRVKHVASVVSEGDEILVKIIGIDPEKKHISLSLKQAAIEEEDDDFRYEDDDGFDDDDDEWLQ